MTKEILELAQQLLDAAHYCTQLEKLEDHCREVARKLEALAEDGEPQNPRTAGKAFHQIAHDEGKPDLAALWQAVIDNTKGGGFWLGEILLATIGRETGFNGTDTRPDREGK